MTFEPQWRSHIDPSTGNEAGGWDYPPIFHTNKRVKLYEVNHGIRRKEILMELNIMPSEVHIHEGGRFRGLGKTQVEATQMIQEVFEKAGYRRK